MADAAHALAEDLHGPRPHVVACHEGEALQRAESLSEHVLRDVDAQLRVHGRDVLPARQAAEDVAQALGGGAIGVRLRLLRAHEEPGNVATGHAQGEAPRVDELPRADQRPEVGEDDRGQLVVGES